MTRVIRIDKRGERREELLRKKMTELAQRFPCLVNAPGTEPYQPEELDRWAAGPASSGERITARFVLSVWSPDTDWACGRFDLMEALRIWGPTHRDPFLKWAADPWWP
jgi:hypothetical protein